MWAPASFRASRRHAMRPSQNCHRPLSEERDFRDTTQPWLDFGRWLAGEKAGDETSGSQGIPSFARIAERHFRDLVPYAEHGNSLELRRAMHRRFIRAMHLAFGSEDLPELAARQPPHLFDLIEHLRADFDLQLEQAASPSPRLVSEPPAGVRRAG